ncbi:MAG: hypothetical protein GC179_19890 [Anaerolineaceae bacterium]|nr:hypothetical protein [Anaerolineaceae bacterium]
MRFDFDIVIPGNYFCDVIFTQMHDFPMLSAEIYSEGIKVVAGGGALNTATGLRRLGINAGWIGTLGTDFFSQYARNYVQQEKLDISLVRQLDTPLERVTVALSYPNDRAFVTYAQKPPDIVELVMSAIEKVSFRHLHFPSLNVYEAMPELLQICKAKHIRVSMDCQHSEETLDTPLVQEILSQVDIFMPNAVEARRVTGESKLSAALNRLSQITTGVVVKNGAEGAMAQFGSTGYHSRAFEVTPLDTTGAGDSFNAGFLAAYLQNLPIKTCLRWGNYCGAQSTLGYGASTTPSSVPDEDSLT